MYMFATAALDKNPAIVVSESQYETLADFICAAELATSGLALLWEELERAQRVADAELPGDVAATGARITFTDGAQARHTVRLVHPDAVDGPDDVAVTSELGAALLGLRAGACFQWRSASGRPRRLWVESVRPAEPQAPQ
jgi:regulator of nucleoside diphosphate kinase